MDRLPSIITFKPEAYRSVADDNSATGKAAIIAVIGAIASGIGAGLANQESLVGFIIGTTVASLIGWAISAFLLSFIAGTFFKGKTNFMEMLRVSGFSRIFNVLGILAAVPVLGGIISIVVLVCNIIATVIGIREAAEFDTTKAVLTAVIANLIAFLIVTLVAGALLTVLAVGSAMTGGQ